MATPQQDPGAGYNVEDPDVTQQGINDQANLEFSRSDAASRRNIGMQQGLQTMFGNPLVNKQRSIQDRFKNILHQVDATAPDNEDPLSAQERTAKAVASGMIDVSPQIAMQAAGNLVKIQQARAQQQYLSAERGHVEAQTAEAQAGTAEKQTKADAEKMAARYVMVQQGKDELGLPTWQEHGAPVSMYDDRGNRRDEFASELAAAQNGAPQGSLPMTIDQLNMLRSKTGESAAMARVMAAQMRAAQAGANADRFTARIMVGTDMASTAASNIMSLPFGASSGRLGIGLLGGSHVGSTIMRATGDSLKWQLSDDDTKQYNIYRNGLTRGLATLETSGGLQGMKTLADQIDKTMAIQSGDTIEDVMSRMAEVRQLIHNGIDPQMAGNKMTPEQRELMANHLRDVDNAIPYTVKDVIAMRNTKGAQTIGEAATERQKKTGLVARPADKTNPSPGTYTEDDIAADMRMHSATREQVLAAYAKKGIKAAH